MSDEKPKKPRHLGRDGERPMRRRPAPGRDAENSVKPRGSFAKAGAKPRAAERAVPPSDKSFEGERIAKVMARAGVCSRREAEQWIADGRVSVNGNALTSPAFNVRDGDRVFVDGAPLAERERTRLFLFHKPAGLVTSAKDPEGRETVFDYLARHYPDLPRVVSVGRLDINTEGLLLLTNDGGLARTLELPATGWARRYRVRAHGEVDQAALDELKKGVTVDGVTYAPIEAKLDRVQGSNAWISMSLREGKNREIKRVLEQLRLDVTRLIRISYGPFQLGDLAEGAAEEVRLKVLREQLGKGLAELAGVDFSSPLHDRAEPMAAESQEKRERAEKRTRKHVSVLRAQGAKKGDRGPRARIERGATSDRKGRAVAVEKIVVARPKAEQETRNGRNFRSLRRAEEGSAPRAERTPRFSAKSGEDRRSYSHGAENHAKRGAEKPEREQRASRRNSDDRRAPSTERVQRRPNRRFEAADAPRTRRDSHSGGEDVFKKRERPPARSGDRRERPPERKEGRSREEFRASPSSADRHPMRTRNLERDVRSGGERSARPPSGDAPRTRRDSHSGGEAAFKKRERPPARDSDRRERPPQPKEGKGREEFRASRSFADKRSSRSRNLERDDRRGGERAARSPSGDKPQGRRVQGDAKPFEGPRRYEGARKPGGSRPPSKGGKLGGRGGKPNGRPTGGARKPRGPRD